MAKQGIFLSVAEDENGKNPRIVLESNGLPVALLNLAGENAAEQHSESIRVIDSEHAWVHLGKSFIVGYFAANIANGDNIEILIEPSNAVHAIFKIATTGDADVHFFEDTTKTTGTALTAFNKNRYSSSVSGITASHTPGGTGDGTEFPTGFIPGGSGGNASGGSDGGYANEIILRSGKKYLLRIVNRAGSNATISANIDYYETDAA